MIRFSLIVLILLCGCFAVAQKATFPSGFTKEIGKNKYSSINNYYKSAIELLPDSSFLFYLIDENTCEWTFGTYHKNNDKLVFNWDSLKTYQASKDSIVYRKYFSFRKPEPFRIINKELLLEGNRLGTTPPTSLSVELFSSSKGIIGKGFLIDSFSYMKYNISPRQLTVVTNSKKQFTFPSDSIWGYKLHYVSGLTELHRIIPEDYYNGYFSAPTVLQIDSLIIYRYGYSGSKHSYYYFSKNLDSKLYPLTEGYLNSVFSNNTIFLDLVKREMNQWTGYNALSKKSNNFVVVELYRYSLLKPDKKSIQDTMNYHLKQLKSDGIYWLFNLKVNQFIANNDPGNLVTKFPYQVRDTVTGIIQRKVLETDARPFNIKPLFVDFSFEYNRFKNCFAVQLGFASNYSNSFHFGLTYGIANDLNLSSKKHQKFTIKTCMNLSYYTYSSFANDIDNTNKYLTIFDNTYRPRFVVANKSKNHATTYTYYNATDVSVSYNIRSWSLCPQVIIANNRRQRIFWAVNAGWDFVFYDTSGLTFTQNADGYQHRKDHIVYNQDGISSNLNGRGVFKAPFKFGGPSIGVSIGFYFNE
jgi:hypothetical protein